jgi:hypothetical protein
LREACARERPFCRDANCSSFYHAPHFIEPFARPGLDDITGDGVAELILARQNLTPDPSKNGAGAVTIVIGGAAVATQAASLLRIAPANLLIGTDQENSGGEGHSGAVSLVRGDVHLLSGGLVDL